MSLNGWWIIGIKKVCEMTVKESINNTHIEPRIKKHRAHRRFHDI
jgi:hypothetical protein